MTVLCEDVPEALGSAPRPALSPVVRAAGPMNRRWKPPRPHGCRPIAGPATVPLCGAVPILPPDNWFRIPEPTNFALALDYLERIPPGSPSPGPPAERNIRPGPSSHQHSIGATEIRNRLPFKLFRRVSTYSTIGQCISQLPNPYFLRKPTPKSAAENQKIVKDLVGKCIKQSGMDILSPRPPPARSRGFSGRWWSPQSRQAQTDGGRAFLTFAAYIERRGSSSPAADRARSPAARCRARIDRGPKTAGSESASFWYNALERSAKTIAAPGSR